jgi:hypothetical protein
MPKIIAKGPAGPALQTEPDAHDYRFAGIEFLPETATTFVYDLMDLGDGGPAQSSLDDVEKWCQEKWCQFIFWWESGEKVVRKVVSMCEKWCQQFIFCTKSGVQFIFCMRKGKVVSVHFLRGFGRTASAAGHQVQSEARRNLFHPGCSSVRSTAGYGVAHSGQLLP